MTLLGFLVLGAPMAAIVVAMSMQLRPRAWLVEAIPAGWVAGVEDSQPLPEVAARLWAARIGGNKAGQR